MNLKEIKNRCVQYLDDYRDAARKKYPIVQNINLNKLKKQNRILLCYLDYEDASKRIHGEYFHSNIPEFFQIINVLIQMDFVVDICANNAIKALPVINTGMYDFIFGFGDVFREACRRNPKAHSILYMTENPYEISCNKEQERVNYFCQRHSINCKGVSTYLRSGLFYKKGDIDLADTIITLGNERVYQYPQTVYKLYPTAIFNPVYRHTLSSKNNHKFLVFGAGGIISKGIDLLVEVFEKHSDWILYICGGDVTSELAKLGYKIPSNIIDCGFVNVNSEKFCQLVRECTFSVLPSCSEGTSTSTITCMYHGLIPIISRECGLNDFSNGCIFFEDCSVKGIEKTLENIIYLPENEKEKLINNGIKIVKDNFMLDAFTKRFNEIMEQIAKNENSFKEGSA